MRRLHLLLITTLILLIGCAQSDVPDIISSPASATRTPTLAPTLILTHTPTSELTATDQPTAAASATFGPTQTPIPAITTNADWTPVVEIFGGVEMVLVPPGCFNMGSDDEDSDEDEQPIHEQCFDVPFWIDRTEVTNAQYGSTGEESSEPDQPRDSVTFPEAVAYCESRGARLPTEAEWEYAARGPSSYLYPWGTEFNSENVVYMLNASQQSAPVGSKPNGASWVGAVDMVGNLWEWTSTIYAYTYPYDPADSRESLDNLSVPRTIRGGSWSNDYQWQRAAERKSKHPTREWYGYVGFRCAMDYSVNEQ